MNKAERAIKACREAADAIEVLPASFRRFTMLGPIITAESLRKEADHIENILSVLNEGLDESV